MLRMLISKQAKNSFSFFIMLKFLKLNKKVNYISLICYNLALIVLICEESICVKAKRRLPASLSYAPIK